MFLFGSGCRRTDNSNSYGLNGTNARNAGLTFGRVSIITRVSRYKYEFNDNFLVLDFRVDSICVLFFFPFDANRFKYFRTPPFARRPDSSVCVGQGRRCLLRDLAQNLFKQ